MLCDHEVGVGVEYVYGVLNTGPYAGTVPHGTKVAFGGFGHLEKNSCALRSSFGTIFMPGLAHCLD